MDCISGNITKDAIGDRYLKRLTQKRLNLIDGSITSYCYIINSTERLHMIKQENELASVLCDIESDRIGAKEESNNRAMEAEYQSKNKYEQKYMRDDY